MHSRAYAHINVKACMLYIPRAGVELRDLQLTFVDDKTVVQLPMLSDSFGMHLHLSHSWRNAQDQVSEIKALLVTMIPTCKVYLDEDGDADEWEVEGQVEQATVFLCFLTSEYVGSRRCMLELLTAWREHKPIIVVREADVRCGSLVQTEARPALGDVGRMARPPHALGKAFNWPGLLSCERDAEPYDAHCRRPPLEQPLERAGSAASQPRTLHQRSSCTLRGIRAWTRTSVPRLRGC